MDEKDLRAIIIDSEIRKWLSSMVEPCNGWLHDWDGWLPQHFKYYAKILLAHDAEFRNEYLEFTRNPEKRREYGVENVADEELDQAFFERILAIWREKGEKTLAQKAAAIYFADDELRTWVQEIFLNSDGWRYNVSRDDRFLGEILSDSALRIKAFDVVRKVFQEYVLPFVGTKTFLSAKKYGYCPDDYFRDVYRRLFMPNARRKNAANAIDFYLKAEPRPCATLREWITLESKRELERALQRLRRAHWTSICLSGNLNHLARKAEKPKPDENETPFFDMQELFERFYADAPSSALLVAAYLNSDVTFNELENFWNIGLKEKVDGKTLNKQYGRALERWRSTLENTLNVKFADQETWKKIFRTIKRDARTDDEETGTRKEEKEPNFSGVPKNPNWQKNLRFLSKPTKHDEMLLTCVLENIRGDEAGFDISFLWKETQGSGLLNPNVEVLPVRRRGGERGRTFYSELFDVSPLQNPLLLCGSPALVDVLSLKRKHWLNRYAENGSLTFHFESNESPRSPLYWKATVKIPTDADAETEVGVVLDGYNRLNVTPVKFTIGDVDATVSWGVAKFKVGDLRVGLARSAPSATLKISRLNDGKGGIIWGSTLGSSGRLLWRAPILPDRKR